MEINTPVFFQGKCAQTAAKTMVVDRKKPEGTSSAIFGVGTAAKCCKLKRYADRVAVPEGKFRILNFSPSTNFFFPFVDIKIFFSQV